LPCRSQPALTPCTSPSRTSCRTIATYAAGELIAILSAAASCPMCGVPPMTLSS